MHAISRSPRRPEARLAGRGAAQRTGWRGFAAVLVSALIAGMLTLTGAGAAVAQPGDFTLGLSTETDVTIGDTFNYVATLNFEGVDSQNPASGVVLTTTLPAGLTFESVPTGPGQVLASASYDSTTRVLTMTLNDTTQSVVSIAYTVSQVNQQDKFEGMQLTTDISGTGGPTGPVTSLPVTTTIHGDNDYVGQKSYTTIAGSDNRTVTYRFNVGTTHSTSGTTFTSWAQELTDTLPAGAQLVGASPAWNGGSWDTSAWPTATWTRTGTYGPSGNTLDPAGQGIWLTVYYPETVAGWELGARPDPNTVSLNTEDANGVSHAGTPTTVQGPAFGPASGAGIAAVKYDVGSSSAGMLSHQTQTVGSYIGPQGSPDLSELTLTDSGATGGPNADWFNHIELSQLFVTFDPSLAAQDLEYTLEYQIDGSSAWTTYTGYTIATGRTGASLILAVQNVGSAGWQGGGQDLLELPVGSTLSGWRLTVATGAGETVPVGSEARVRMSGQPVFRGISDGVQPANVPAYAGPGALPNTVTVDGGAFSGQATSQFTPVDSVYLTTRVQAPTSLSVGGTGSFRASIMNQNPSETYTDSKMSVVLPCGVQYDPAQTITPVTPTTVGVPAAPAIGSGATVDATSRVTDANGCQQQVVEFSFDAVPPMRPPGLAKDRWVEISGWSYDIPVTVLAQAYDPTATSIPVTSYVHSEDPRFLSTTDGGTGPATVPMSGYGGFFGPDDHDFDAARDTVAVSTDNVTINVAGGLLISKLSSASAAGPWALTSPIGTDAFWQIFVSDVLPNPVSNTVLFDALPTIATGHDFDTALSGAVTGAPAGSLIEYSTDATSATSGAWTTDPTGAIAFRVTIPAITVGQSFTLTVPTSVVGGAEYGMTDVNVVDAAATYEGSPVTFDSNEAAVTVAATPAISIVKQTNGIDVPTAADAPIVPKGSDVQWSYEVTNTGNTILEDVSVADLGGADGAAPAAVSVSAPAGFDGTLAPGDSVTFTASGIAIEGLYHNVATATGEPVDDAGAAIPGVTAPSAQDESWYTGGTVQLGITKQVSASESGPWDETVEVESGSSVWWKVTVTNTGTAALENVVVTDPQAAGFGEQTIPVLAAGESKSFVFEQKQLTSAVTNVANASVVVGGQTVAVSDDASATVKQVAPPGPPGLAWTGFAGSWLIWVAGALLLLGAVMVVLRLRKRKTERIAERAADAAAADDAE